VKRAAAAAALLAVSWVLPSSAQLASEEAVRFRYEAPSDCPTAEVLTARVRERTSRGRDPAPEELARTFTVSIMADSPGFLGTIEFLDDAGSPVSRRVRGEECDAVVSSLALITALALDSTLREGTEVGADETVTHTAQPVPTKPPRSAPAVAATTTPVIVRPARPARPLLVSARVGLAAAFESSLPAPVWGMLGQLDFRGDWALRLLAHYEDAEIEVDSGRAIAVRVLGIETSVCPLRPHVGDFSLHPCVSFDIGSLRAGGIKSEQLVSVDTKTLVWAALGAETRLAWEPREPFWAELRGGLGVPLLHEKFSLENPRKIAFDIDYMTAHAGASLGVRFW
jgi:hypothetical protein